MSTGCAVLFGGNIYCFPYSPARWHHLFLRTLFLKHLFPKKNKKIGHCKNQNKSEKQQKHFYVEKMVATCSFELVWDPEILTQYTANF
jgi:hypothetical protein